MPIHWNKVTGSGDVEIPIDRLKPDILIKMIENFVTREGTDYGHQDYAVQQKVKQVHTQLKEGKAHIVFDDETDSWNIVTTNQL
tara:strand:- start:126 stop:377 length:252 start_codon:yes stop_codon:yes gene_type:complete